MRTKRFLKQQSRENMQLIDWDAFQRVDIRVVTIVAAEKFPEARRPAYKLRVDFGAKLGVKKSSAQISIYIRDRI